jgi:hypothetical protein
VDSLRTGCNFFSSHEDIIRVCVVRVMRTDHSVKWPGTNGILINDVEICVMLLWDYLAKCLLCFSWEVFEWILLDSSFL